MKITKAFARKLAAESETFRNYLIDEIYKGEYKDLEEEVRELVLSNRGNKIAAIKSLRDLSRGRIDEFEKCYADLIDTTNSWAAYGRLGLIDAKRIVEKYLI